MLRPMIELWQTFNWADKALMVLNLCLHPWKVFFIRYKKVAKALDIGDRKRLEFQRDIDGIDWRKYYISHGQIVIDIHNSRICLISTTQRDKIG